MFYNIPAEEADNFRQALTTIARIYSGNVFAKDMLIAMGKNLTFLWDEKFVESFNSTATNNVENSLVWRLHTLTWAATQVLHLEGDFVECGVFRGFSSAVVCKYLNFQNLPRTFYLYDTFAGLPEETSTETERTNWNEGYKSDTGQLAFVRQLFATFPNVKIIQGIVPFSFETALPENIVYLHIDMNSEQAEILALERLFDRLVPGGIIVLDDFGWTTCRAQAAAETKFMADRGLKILELPTGQGLVIKLVK